MTAPLFDPGPASEPPSKESATVRLTKRNNASLARGIHPATNRRLAEPLEHTCGDCSHCIGHGHNLRTYWKCDRMYVTFGAGTDIRKSWPACVLWEAA